LTLPSCLPLRSLLFLKIPLVVELSMLCSNWESPFQHHNLHFPNSFIPTALLYFGTALAAVLC
jgi:hypothetical protein